MSSSPFPYTCELCGAEGLTDEGMRSHTLEAHISGRPDCPFCDSAVPQPQLAGHVQRVHLHYLTPERELMAFIDEQSPSFDEDTRMTTDSCSYNTPGSVNGWHSPDPSSNHNGAISKTYQNGFQDRDNTNKINRSNRDEDRFFKSPKNVNLVNGVKNINISNGVIPKKRDCDEGMTNGCDRKAHSSPAHSASYEGSPNKNKLTMASAGQGSPLRSQLALKLRPNTPKKSVSTPSPTVQCLLCDFTSTCPRKLEEHINRAHFDLTSPSVMANANLNANSTGNPTLGLSNLTSGLSNQNSGFSNQSSGFSNPTLGFNNPTIALDNPTLGYSAMALSPGPQGSSFQCPICERDFTTGTDVEMHVNVDHRDILSPQKSDQIDSASSEDVAMMEEVSNYCPVCDQPLPLSQHELIQHIEDHFERGEGAMLGGLSMSKAEREAMKNREEQEFQLLRAQYGMEEDEEGYTNRATNSLKRAVYSGALSVASYYERSVGLKKASTTGQETGSSRTSGILERIAELNTQNPNIVKTYLCSAVDHYASTYGDKGWGCGYRNMQMLLSGLMHHPAYWSRISSQGGLQGVPSIPRLQRLLERAWAEGIDTQGSEQLGCKLYNTRKWIGACEVVTMLTLFRIRCSLVDFHRPSAADGSHPALLDWVLRYFQHEPDQYKAPLYLQHQGHSRTIIGYEKHKDGKATLLVLDPSHSPGQVRQVVQGPPSSGLAALRLLRRGGAALRARQYQLLNVQGLITSDEDYEASKVLKSLRIP